MQGETEIVSAGEPGRDHDGRDVPLLLRAEEAARLLNIGRSKVFEMMAAGELPGVVRFGRSVRISRAALEWWLGEQTGEAA